MALLPEDEEKQKQQAAGTQPTGQQPAQPQQNNVVQQAPQKPAPPKKATGFTNLSRIMQANRGNTLGSTVAGGVSGAGQQLQSGIKQSQAAFQTEADKNRLDTPESAAKRASVLGRFDASTYKPDESKFAISSGLQSQYEQNKAAQQQTLEQQKQSSAQQQAMVQARLKADQEKMAKLDADRNAYLADPNRKVAGGMIDGMSWGGTGQVENLLYKRARGGLSESINSLTGLSGAMQASAAASEKQAADNLSKLETQYGEMSKAEKDAFMKSETERLMAENAPTEQEIQDFTKYQSGAYTGPKELQDFQTLLGKGQQTATLGNLARSTGGRQELLKQFVGGRDYTQGQRGLDEAILGQDKSSALSQAAKSVRGAEKSVTSANKLAGAQAQDLVGKAKQFGTETQKMIGEKRGVISSQVDEQMKALQGSEAGRQKDFESMQGILSGSDPRYAGMDKTTRMGLALQSASDAGYLSPEEAQQLVGEGGLVQRAQAAGLDANKLLGERLQSIAAQGIDRRAGASTAQEGIISAMDKLAGKVGTDVEFGSGQEQYKAGQNKFDVASLKDYIAKTEAEKMKDPAYAAKLKAAGLTPMQQTVGGLSQILGQANTSGAIGAALAPGLVGAGIGAAYGGGAGALASGLGGYGMAGVAPVAAAGMIGADLLSGGDSSAKAAEGAVQTASGLAGMGMQSQDAILRALSKYAPAGSQISKVLDYKSQLQQKGLGELTKEGMNVADGLRDLTQTGRLDQALAKLSGFDAVKNLYGNAGKELGKGVTNVSKAISTAFGGGKTGNWKPHELNTLDAATGKKTKIGTFANKSSQEILNQMLGQHQLGATNIVSKKGKAEGATMMNELLKYYNAALKREQG